MRRTIVFFFVICIIILCSSLDGQEESGATPTRGPPSEDDEMYRQLSPGAFFAMKDNVAMGTGMGPMGPGMGPVGPGMGPVGPGMGPMDPAGPGMGPTGPVRPIMGPKGPLGPMKPGITDTRDGKKGYEHFDLSILDDIARKSQYSDNFGVTDVLHVQGLDVNRLIYNLCYCLSYIWRRGRLSIRKYYHLRDIYSNHLPFEVGYITHVIMVKYQNMLELYQYCNSKVAKNKTDKEYITRMHLVHFHHSIEQGRREIEHLCNMLNELTKKYSVKPYDPVNKFDIPPPGYDDKDSAERSGKGGRAGKGRKTPKPKAYLAQKVEEVHKLLDQEMEKKKRQMLIAREYFKKHGRYPTTTRTQQPLRLWSPNLDYEWSDEGEW
ncbi:uncharacterized protein LOC134802405 [Cydia splendana]|uniref:uncharacterized protein LOC134802405 n=1 Tax=Cydia splendana TaxID=1100963 RepID=UPI0028F48589